MQRGREGGKEGRRREGGKKGGRKGKREKIATNHLKFKLNRWFILGCQIISR